MSALFSAAIDGDARVWGNLAHVQLKCSSVIGFQLAERTRSFAGRAVKSLLLNRTRIYGQLNNRVPAMRAGEGDPIQIHNGFVSYWSGDYSQAECQL